MAEDHACAYVLPRCWHNRLFLHVEGSFKAKAPGSFAGFLFPYHALNANMADHLVGPLEELHESEVSQSLMFCFDSASPENSCFVVDLLCINSLCLRVAVALNATRRDINLPPLTSKGNSGSFQFVETKKRSSRSPREPKFLCCVSG